MNEPFGAAIARIVSAGRVRANAPMAPLTTFRVGGPAEWLVDVETVDELAAVLRAAADAGVPVTRLGSGSNVVVADAGIRGVVVRAKLLAVSQTGPDRVRAEAGVTINGLVRWTTGRGLAGLEAWAGTPGTVGGAIYGNAHWSGRNIGDLVSCVRLLSARGTASTVERSDMAFAYDTSRLQTSDETLVWAEFAVSPGVTEDLRARARAALAFRKRTQPLAMPSAGCMFQNPDPLREAVPPNVPPSAGALIDRAGLKGRRIGGAMISETHANFIVNGGHATAADIRALAEVARRAVRDRFGVDLRDEVRYLGTF